MTPRVSRTPKLSLVVTCEHASNALPSWCRVALRDRRKLNAALQSHEGFDVGALPLARVLARSFSAPLFAGSASRLAVDLNRSVHHPQLHKLMELSREQRARLVTQLYVPFREAVRTCLADRLRDGPVLHLSVHSFTPALNGDTRTADIGILYDPRCDAERAFAACWQKAWRRHSAFRVRRNYPYRGSSDGHTTALRARFNQARTRSERTATTSSAAPARLDHAGYMGIELEVNQNLVGSAAGRRQLASLSVLSLRAVLAALCGWHA